MNPISVLVPAAGALPDPHLGPAPPFFRQPIELAAGSQLAVEQICRHYSGSATVERLVVITDPQARLQRPLQLPPATTIEEVPPQPHICATLAAALPAVETPWVLVNPITTLPSHRPEPAPVVLIGNKRLYQENWAAFQPGADQQWQALPKGSQSLSYPFTGVLCCRTAVLQQILATLSPAQGGDLIHVASALLREHNAQALQVPWLDLGHHATLASCRRERLNSRAFNSLTYCGRGDLMLKRSQDQQRLLAEAHYLQALPPTLQRHFPWSQLQGDGNAASLQLEYIPLPTLAELFLHYDIGPNAWQGLWRRLAAIRAEMAQASTPMQASPGWLYGHKLQQRWQQLTPEPWHRLPLRLNGIALPSLEQAVELTLAELKPLEQPTALGWIHGDLCFNNILGDPMGHTIRLIDPRGEPGNGSLPRGYGDPRYDLAKLHHSVFGLYDAVVNRLYELRLHADTTWDLHLYAPPNLTLVRDLFLQDVVADAIPFATLQLLSRALFLSMLPLHAEDPLRQRALAAIGLMLFTHHDPAQCANRF
jgi:hypothetical protein